MVVNLRVGVVDLVISVPLSLPCMLFPVLCLAFSYVQPQTRLEQSGEGCATHRDVHTASLFAIASGCIVLNVIGFQ
jgi:hypothetical protein